MNEAQVISVNPGIKTLGELSAGSDTLRRISRTIAAPCRRVVSPFKKFVNFFFGVNGKVNSHMSVKMLLLRLVCGSLMLSSVLLEFGGISFMEMEFGPHSIVMLGVGISLVLGLFCRVSSLAGAGWFGWLLVDSIIAMQPDVTAGSLFLLMMVFTVLGPGIFSTDQLMRIGIFSLRKKLLRARKERRMRNVGNSEISYRAFAEAERRIV